jgi:hypothetical protein
MYDSVRTGGMAEDFDIENILLKMTEKGILFFCRFLVKKSANRCYS